MYLRAPMVLALALAAGCTSGRTLTPALTSRLGLAVGARATERRSLGEGGGREARSWTATARATLTFSSRPPRPALELPVEFALGLPLFDDPGGCGSAALCAWERRARDEAWMEIGRLLH